MIKVIEHGLYKYKHVYTIVCPDCECRFMAEDEDMYMGHKGLSVHCPDCKRECYEGQGGSDEWTYEMVENAPLYHMV